MQEMWSTVIYLRWSKFSCLLLHMLVIINVVVQLWIQDGVFPRSFYPFLFSGIVCHTSRRWAVSMISCLIYIFSSRQTYALGTYKLQNVLFDAANTTTVIASELDCLRIWSFNMNFCNFSIRNFFKEWCALTNYCNGCMFDHSYCLLLQVFSANGLSKYYIHQIACYLPSRADVLPNDISAKQPGYACVLANVLEAATWILSEPKFASDRVRVYCFYLSSCYIILFG